MENKELANGDTTITVNFVFGRRVLSTILTTYLPTILICLVCFSTNYFKEFYFEATVTVNLTAMLVLTTLFISVSTSLPQTSYLKMIDIWLIFNLLVPFSEVLLQTYIELFRDDNKDNDGNIDYEHNALKRKQEKGQQDSKEAGNANAKVALSHPAGWYDRNRMSKRQRQAAFWENLATKGLPSIFVAFTFGYFLVGFVLYKGIG